MWLQRSMRWNSVAVVTSNLSRVVHGIELREATSKQAGWRGEEKGEGRAHIMPPFMVCSARRRK